MIRGVNPDTPVRLDTDCTGAAAEDHLLLAAGRGRLREEQVRQMKGEFPLDGGGVGWIIGVGVDGGAVWVGAGGVGVGVGLGRLSRQTDTVRATAARTAIPPNTFAVLFIIHSF